METSAQFMSITIRCTLILCSIVHLVSKRMFAYTRWVSKIDDFAIHMKIEEGCAEATVREYCRDILRFERESGRKMTEAKQKHIRNWLNGLQLDGSNLPQSAARKHAALTAYGKWLVREKYRKNNPMLDIKKPKGEKRLPDILSVEEVQRILNTHVPRKNPAHEARDTAMLQLMYGSGLRRAEVCGVSIGDLEPNGTLRVIGKGNKERPVFVTPVAAEAINRYLAFRPDAKAGEPLFLTARKTRLSCRHLWVCFKQLVKASGIGKRVKPHTFRHAFATHQCQNGADIRTIQKLLGHTSISTTQIYLDVSMEHMRETFEKAHPLGAKAA